MPDNSAYPSLCSTCRPAATGNCANAAGGQSFYCELFEIDSPSQQIREHLPPRQEPPATELTDDIGLCCDCENRRSCMFPKPEGGVWHCEEYQ